MRTLLLRDDQVAVLRYALAIADLTLRSQDPEMGRTGMAQERDAINEIKLLLRAEQIRQGAA